MRALVSPPTFAISCSDAAREFRAHDTGSIVRGYTRIPRLGGSQASRDDGSWQDAGHGQYQETRRAGTAAVPDLATGSTAPRVDNPASIAAAIGVQIRQLRKRQDISAAELAHQAGLSAGMLSKIENGAVSASLESLSRWRARSTCR